MSSTPEVIEASAVELEPDMSLVRSSTLALAVTPTVKAEELVARLDVIKRAMDTAMVKDTDYGVIPGTKNPTLLKPGAEKLAVLFQFDLQTTCAKTWGPGDHLTVEARTTVFHAPTGARLGSGEGLCSTREKKYGKRQRQRACPNCGMETVFKFRNEGEGFYCWAKKGGCGAKFPETDPRIVGQEVGEVENPDLPDCWNTVVKIAKKRAIVDAVLMSTGASAIFTQDAEDLPHDDGSPASMQNRAGSPAGSEQSGTQPTARPAASSPRPASAAEKQTMRDQAAAIDLTPTEFANIILEATGAAPRTWTSDEAAEQTLNRLIDRLAAKAVDRVLAGIAAKAGS